MPLFQPYPRSMNKCNRCGHELSHGLVGDLCVNLSCPGGGVLVDTVIVPREERTITDR
jgi:uncharacterized protein (DUF983 family)